MPDNLPERAEFRLDDAHPVAHGVLSQRHSGDHDHAVAGLRTDHAPVVDLYCRILWLRAGKKRGLLLWVSHGRTVYRRRKKRTGLGPHPRQAVALYLQ